jgi:hypothetical protein
MKPMFQLPVMKAAQTGLNLAMSAPDGILMAFTHTNRSKL